MSSYLFVLCPPYSGSTLLWKLLSTSANVSALPGEGQFLPELRGLMREKPWDATHTLPWQDIKAVWDSRWDHGKSVLLEKSPPNIMVRNPYAQGEGLMRRNNWPARRAANFAMMCLRTQLENRQQLHDATALTYESLVRDPAGTCASLGEFMPELSDMEAGASFEVHSIDGTVNRPIMDLNEKKIAALPADTIASFNEVFTEQRETLDAWDYDLLGTDSV